MSSNRATEVRVGSNLIEVLSGEFRLVIIYELLILVITSCSVRHAKPVISLVISITLSPNSGKSRNHCVRYIEHNRINPPIGGIDP